MYQCHSQLTYSYIMLRSTKVCYMYYMTINHVYSVSVSIAMVFKINNYACTVHILNLSMISTGWMLRICVHLHVVRRFRRHLYRKHRWRHARQCCQRKDRTHRRRASARATSVRQLPVTQASSDHPWRHDEAWLQALLHDKFDPLQTLVRILKTSPISLISCKFCTLKLTWNLHCSPNFLHTKED